MPNRELLSVALDMFRTKRYRWALVSAPSAFEQRIGEGDGVVRRVVATVDHAGEGRDDRVCLVISAATFAGVASVMLPPATCWGK